MPGRNPSAVIMVFSAATGTGKNKKLPVATRWGSTVTCLNSARANKISLRRHAIDEEPQPLLDSPSLQF